MILRHLHRSLKKIGISESVFFNIFHLMRWFCSSHTGNGLTVACGCVHSKGGFCHGDLNLCHAIPAMNAPNELQKNMLKFEASFLKKGLRSVILKRTYRQPPESPESSLDVRKWLMFSFKTQSNHLDDNS